MGVKSANHSIGPDDAVDGQTELLTARGGSTTSKPPREAGPQISKVQGPRLLPSWPYGTSDDPCNTAAIWLATPAFLKMNLGASVSSHAFV